MSNENSDSLHAMGGERDRVEGITKLRVGGLTSMSTNALSQ